MCDSPKQSDAVKWLASDHVTETLARFRAEGEAEAASKRPWTDGPWEVYEHERHRETCWMVSGPGQDVFDVYGETDEECVANAALGLLAGEMAEAILEAAAEAECIREHKRCYAENLCVSVAMKLRAIGDTDA